MKKYLLLHLCLLAYFGCSSLQAQEPQIKIGAVSYDEVAMTTYEADTSAEAVVLFDKAIIDFGFENIAGGAYFQITQTRQQRIKILKTSALSRGIVKIPYYRTGTPRSSQIIRSIDGYVYNVANGEVVEEKLSRKDITDESGTKDFYVKQLSFPDVKVGSVIDIEYTIDTPFEVSLRPETWYFQRDIPTQWSEYNITIPGHFYYQMIMGGYLPLHINDQKPINVTMGSSQYDSKGVNYRFVVKDAPAFKDEPYITTEDDYYSKIDFELSSYSLPDIGSKSFSTTWEELDITLAKNESFGLQLNRSNFLKDEVKEFNKIKDPVARSEAVYNYMLQNYKWNEYVGIGASENLRKVYSDKQGSCAELNLLMINLLNECDIKAYPVILSTRKHGKIHTAYPLINRFNYVIAAIPNGEEYTFLDATDPQIPYGGLPERCLNDVGRLINVKGKSVFVQLKTGMEYTQMETIKVQLDAESGVMSADYKVSAGGYLSHNMRETFKDSKPETIAEEIKKQNPDWEISDFKTINQEATDKPFELSYAIKQENVANPGIIYLDPMLHAKIKENPFKSKIRNFPVDFGHRTMITYSGEFEIPEGFVVDEKPESAMIALPNKGGRFIYNISVDGNLLKVMSQVRLTKPIYYAEEYPYLKEFYNQVVQKHAEQVVLKEK